jgi:hypothetical protein
MGQYRYTIRTDVYGVLGGTMNIMFWDEGSDLLSSPHTVFYGAFGGLIAGAVNSLGTAWMNYDVRWIRDKKWEADFQANFLATATNVNLWGLEGEVIGNTAAAGVGVIAGTVGGRGYFGFPSS